MSNKAMSDKNTILAILELDSDPDNLINRVTWIAQSFDYRVHLVLFEPESGALLGGFAISNEAEAIREELQRTQDEIVESYAAKLKDKGIDVMTSVLRQRPLDDGILAIAMSVKAKIIVKAIRFHSIAEALDREIVQTANVVAKAIDGEVHLLHTYERISGIGKAANRTFKPVKLPIDEIDARISKEHRKALDALAADCGIDADHTHQLPGNTQDILPTFVRSRNAGLVVMGALARWGVKRMLIGSTAERVIDHLPCDILIVRLSEYQLCE
jgi:universal stress protein E